MSGTCSASAPQVEDCSLLFEHPKFSKTDANTKYYNTWVYHALVFMGKSSDGNRKPFNSVHPCSDERTPASQEVADAFGPDLDEKMFGSREDIQRPKSSNDGSLLLSQNPSSLALTETEKDYLSKVPDAINELTAKDGKYPGLMVEDEWGSVKE